MKRTHTFAIVAAAVVFLIVLLSSLFTVHQTQQALVLQVGEPRAVITSPGLHVKLPWPLQNVVYVDKRVLNLDLPTEEVISQDKKRLVVDAFARWRITDPLRFFQSLTNEWETVAHGCGCSPFSAPMSAASWARRPSRPCSRANGPSSCSTSATA